MVQCPNCGGLLKFDIASQKMKCDSCSSLFGPYAFDAQERLQNTRLRFLNARSVVVR